MEGQYAILSHKGFTYKVYLDSAGVEVVQGKIATWLKDMDKFLATKKVSLTIEMRKLGVIRKVKIPKGEFYFDENRVVVKIN